MEQAICFFCLDIIIRATEYSDWLDSGGYAGCASRAYGPHTPDDPNDED